MDIATEYIFMAWILHWVSTSFVQDCRSAGKERSHPDHFEQEMGSPELRWTNVGNFELISVYNQRKSKKFLKKWDFFKWSGNTETCRNTEWQKHVFIKSRKNYIIMS
jgi:hypothetical protein